MFGIDDLDRRQHADLGLDAAGEREVDGVLDDVHLGQEVGRDVDRGVGHEQQVFEGERVEHEDVADPAAGAQPAVFLDHGGEQIVGMKVALHHRARFARADHGHALVGGDPVVFLLDDPEWGDIGLELARRIGDALRDRR